MNVFSLKLIFIIPCVVKVNNSYDFSVKMDTATFASFGLIGGK